MRKKPGFNLREVCGEKVVVAEGTQNINFSSIISLNDSAAEIWKAIGEEEFSVDDMAEIIMLNYDIDKEVAMKDCQELASNWIEYGIVDA